MLPVIDDTDSDVGNLLYDDSQQMILRTLQVYVDGTTTMSVHERKASIREFYGTFTYFLSIFLSILV